MKTDSSLRISDRQYIHLADRAMNTLEKLSGGDNDLAIKILNQSVDHCWQGLFELKEDNSNKQQGKKNVFDEWMEAMK